MSSLAISLRRRVGHAVGPDAVLAWGVSRLAIVAVGLLGLASVRLPALGAALTPHAPGASLLEHARAWDTPFYLAIAHSGYAHPADAAFFPLYPLLIRIGTQLTLGLVDPLVIALLLSNAATLAAFVGLARLAEYEGVRANATLLAVVAYPAAFFLALAYADSLFLALAVFAVLFVREQRWWHAAPLLALAGLARPSASVLVVFVVAAIIEERAWRHPGARAAIAAVPTAFALFALVCLVAYQDPLAFVHTERTVFGHALLWPWQSVALAFQQVIHAPSVAAVARILFDVVPVVVAALVAVLTARTQHPRAYTAYTCALVLLIICSPVTSGSGFPLAWVSAARYLLACIPLWLVVGRWLQARAPARGGYLVVGGAVQAIALIFFLQGGWLV